MPGKFILSAAGSRKTSSIVEEALAKPDERILITTYTLENVDQIGSFFIRSVGRIPPNVTIYPWITFLLREGAKPYQSYLMDINVIHSVNYNGDLARARQMVPKSKPFQRYLDTDNDIISEFLSDFIYIVNQASGGAVISRLEGMFDRIYIDEVQDMAGYDLDIIEALMRSSISVTAVGDPRQATFSTNHSIKNKRFNGDMFRWAGYLRSDDVCSVEDNNWCFRCNQEICDFADRLYPHLRATVSRNYEKTGHDGVFQIPRREALNYYQKYSPTCLRYNKSADTMGLPAVNIGVSKGRTFDRVLIFPTAPIKKYLKTEVVSDAGDLPKLYIAVTRARHSVAFVV